jgi:GNAT superfamily N-acetyltransferase
MSNSNLENENEPKTKIEGNKVYWLFPNGTKILRGTVKSMPIRKINVKGPGTFFANNKNRINSAVNFLRNLQAPKIANARRTMNNSNFKKYMRGKLGSGYTARYLSYVGKNTPYKNYVALTNNGRLRGFAVVSNHPSNTRRRNVKVIVGQGTGKLMLNKIVQNARSNGKNKLHLNAVKSAQNFYKKYGFVVLNNSNKNLTTMMYNTRRRP